MLSVGVLSYALADAFGGWCSLIRAGCAFGWNLIYFYDLQIVLFGRLAPHLLVSCLLFQIGLSITVPPPS